MGSTSLLKALAFAAALFSPWGCMQALEFKGLKSSSLLSPASSTSKNSGLRAKTTLQSTDLEEMLSALKAYEESRQKDEEFQPDTLIEMARLCFVIGEIVGKDEKGKFFEKGRHYAELLCQREPSRVEGHYWLALNFCGIAETSRAGLALRLLPCIVDELERALELDETYDQAGPHRVIGRIYSEAPLWPLSEGDPNKSLHHLRTAVKIAPENSTNHLYLAETLIQLGMGEEAHRELERVLTSMQHTPIADNLKNDHKQAVRLIARIKGSRQMPAEIHHNLRY